jgi:hypothetical protein
MSRQKGFKHSIATCKKISDSSLNKIGTNLGKKFSDQWKENISIGLTGRQRPEMVGKLNWNWKGGRYKDGYGYIMLACPNEKSGRRREHLVVMEEFLGRRLLTTERVHHKNGIKSDNRLENLQLFKSNSAHISYEQKLNTFAKILLFGNVDKKLQKILSKLFNSIV